MFGVELAAGIAGGSRALQADALDFLGDSANYAISLAVLSLALAWRARAALLKGVTLGLFSLYVLATTLWGALVGAEPRADMMGLVGFVALLSNGGVALLLFRHRSGDANMRSAWICSRNDAIGNLAVLLAAAGVFGTGDAWPDLIVAMLMAALGLSGGTQIVLGARRELAASQNAARTVAADLRCA